MTASSGTIPEVGNSVAGPDSETVTDQVWPDVQSSRTIEYDDLSGALVLAETVARRFRFALDRSWLTSPESVDCTADADTSVLFDGRTEHGRTVLLGWPDCVARVWRAPAERRNGRSVLVNIRAASEAAAFAALDRLHVMLPTWSAVRKDAIAVRFWTQRAEGTLRLLRRELDAPTWADIAANYPTATRDSLAAAMGDFERLSGAGKVLLWHGPPGTGKTYAVRAFAREHSATVTVDYVLEPESIFGGGAESLSLLLDEPDDHDRDRDRDLNEEEDHWRLLVIEDADELIAVDAKQRAGQGLARLLNLTDGLFGQAVNVMVLLTTNEPMHSFHPALTRPGRCASLVAFQPFDAVGANDWLAAAGASGSAVTQGAPTLAELYAMRDGITPQESPTRQVGFHGGTRNVISSPDQAAVRGE